MSKTLRYNLFVNTYAKLDRRPYVEKYANVNAAIETF